MKKTIHNNGEINIVDKSTDLNPYNNLSDAVYCKTLDFYLKHQLNNKLTVILGNIEYIDKLVDELNNIEAHTTDEQEKLNTIITGINNAIEPIKLSLQKTKRIQETISSVFSISAFYSRIKTLGLESIFCD